MSIKANDPNLRSWVEIPGNSDFPIQNLPFGVFSNNSSTPRVGVAIGNKILDLKELFELNYLNDLGFNISDFNTCYLNDLMKHGKKGTRNLRNRISDLLNTENTELSSNKDHIKKVFIDQSCSFLGYFF